VALQQLTILLSQVALVVVRHMQVVAVRAVI
jgi:hypothetical protein